MGVDVWVINRFFWRKEHTIGDPEGYIANLYRTNFEKEGYLYLYLSTIDPYGDAIFNHDDLPLLLNELIVYRDQYRYQMATKERETITEVIELVESNLGKPHIRIAFLGD